jgi:Fe-S cluster assembly protein SufD
MGPSPHPAWLNSLRLQARQKFEEMAWPTPSEEEWRRTDLRNVPLASYAPAKETAPACPHDEEPGTAAGLIRFEAARCTSVGLSSALQERGVRLLPLDLALEEFEAPLHTMYQTGLDEADNRFLAWHYGWQSHGALLWVPAGVEIREPFLINFQESGSGTMSSPHIVVMLGEGARASVVQRIAGMNGEDLGGLCNPVIDLQVANAAGLQYCEIQELGRSALYVRHVRSRVGRDASFRHFDAQFGARLAKTRVECSLDGSGADVSLDGVYYCGTGQHMDLRTVQNHRAPKATSRAYYKGAVATGGRSVYQGLIDVAPGASGTDAYLTNKNLILGEAARSDSIPTLRIGNNDVKCSHGSTTGRLSDEEVFYLESRGLSRADAREMLVIGYFEDLLMKAPEQYRDDALATIRGRLASAA